MEAKPVVSIVMGSDSDWSLVVKAHDFLNEFGIAHEVRVISAHRSPDIACEYAATARERGIKVIIAAAGGAAHLAGVIAGHTTLPVIGIPVATVALGSAGATNAAILAAEILALSDEVIAERLLKRKQELRDKVVAADAKLNASL